MFLRPLTDSICGMIHTWLLEVAMLKGSFGYRDCVRPGVKVQGLKDRCPIGPVVVSTMSHNMIAREKRCIHTKESFFLEVLDVCSALAVRNDDCCRARI
jgi:hypothetical protein